ncbi:MULTISPECIES: GntR family transcriptional regulator [Roseobacteraceae]
MKKKDDFALTPVPRESIQHRIYVELRTALMTGAFVPGRPMPIQELADSFGTSTMPVREALRRLVAEQALQIQRNRTVLVPLLTEERLQDLLKVRKVVEGSAVEWAAPNIDEDEIRTLEDLCGEISRSAEKGETRDYLIKNRTFRFMIYEKSGSPTLLPIIESLWLQIGPFLNLMYFEGKLDSNIEYFEQLIAALRAGDAKEARAALDRDMEVAAQFMLERMQVSRGDT